MIEHEGLSSRRSTSRMGKFRLGKKGKNAKGKEYPQKLDYFRADPEDENLLGLIHELLGEKPKRLRIMLTSDDLEIVFPQYLKKYGKSGLLCKGTGGKDSEGNPLPALFRIVDKETGEAVDDYPCDPDNCEDYKSGRCKRLASLSFILRDLPALRVWQIDTTSQISIQRLNTRFEDLAALSRAAGRPYLIAGVPLILSLGPVQVKPDKAKKSRTVYCLDLELDHKAFMTGIDPMVAFLSPLAQGGQLDGGPADERTAPDGLYRRSDVEEGADPVAERIETAGEQAEQEPDLPEDIITGVRILGMTKRQTRGLILRYTRDDEFDEDGCLMYLSTLADLVTDGTDISSTLHSLGEEDAAEQAPEAEVVDEEEEEVEEEQEETPAKETKQTKVEEATDVLGLDI